MKQFKDLSHNETEASSQKRKEYIGEEFSSKSPRNNLILVLSNSHFQVESMTVY